MPSWMSVVRLLRRRLVLGVIFAVSLTYCALSLFQHEKRGSLVESAADHNDQLYFSTGKPFLWQMQILEEDGDPGDDATLASNNSNPLKATCRNSVQGKALIVDERGLVCIRGDVLPSGCCSGEITTPAKNPNKSESGAKTTIKRERYSCQTCNPDGCCAVYEYCVSCCLRPSKMDGKRFADESDLKSTHDQNHRTKRTAEHGRADTNAVRHRLRTLDRFQVCLATCRTSSASVRHENTYKDPHSKHCYSMLSQNANLNQRYRRDLNQHSDNNNNNSPIKAVIAPSSTVFLLPLTIYVI